MGFRNKKILFVAAALIVCFAAVAAMTNLANAGIFSDSWRYKMTVSVETPEGLKTGSAVREVTIHKGIKLTPEMSSSIEVKGEAVVVDLGKRGVLFALLRGGVHGEDYGSDILFDAFPGKMKSGEVELSSTQYPTLVTFKNPLDPKTITRVFEMENNNRYPIQLMIKNNRLEELFGKGVKLKKITIQITNESITNDVDKYLPSFGTETGFLEWFNKLPYDDPRKIGPNDFKNGEK